MKDDLLNIMISLSYNELIDTAIDGIKEINDDDKLANITIAIFENSHIDEKRKILDKAKEIYFENYGEEYDNKKSEEPS